MRISQILQNSTKPFPSIEIVPPLKGMCKNELLNNIRPFSEFQVPYIMVTSHRDEVEYVQLPGGSFERRMVKRRISETAVCAAIQQEFKTEVVPHLICGGNDATSTENLLQDFKFLGINNIMALRGDSLLGQKRFTPQEGGYSYASELVSAIRETHHDEFCIGVGAYPQKHFEAVNIETDIQNLKRKVDAGADFIITQMFFDNGVFYDFVNKCRAAGIEVPIIPGLKPISSEKQIQMLPESFSIDIPYELTKEISAHSGQNDVIYQIGQEWCMEQCRDLLCHGVGSVHFYTMGRSKNVIDILKRCF